MLITCAHCGTEFQRRPRGPAAKYCSGTCKANACTERAKEDGRYDEWYANTRAKFVPKPATPRPCRVCGDEFLASRNAAYLCSDDCRKRDAYLRIAPIMHERRARINDADSERFDPREVFERDGYRCYLCDADTEPDADRYAPLKTTLDHVVPLKAGGAHTRENTRCACRRCNITKGARPLEAVKTSAGTNPEAE
ncbi:HNH endonuclease [Streptomyces sp. AJS327]|uniref:HNH endonuclease n=1 Tax=Streptomyces sp. AJS327 TaxID=2545265 RepID=UPI0015E04BE2|nr:HNH endonuclease [Streptomyces sp. AJS327]MBA0054285.1 HNH endonuclease [Streptomyces sp. AJS327]